MGNMSHCRFRNTAGDLNDCLDNFGATKNLSEQEMAARENIIRMACEIASGYGEEVNKYVRIETVEP